MSNNDVMVFLKLKKLEFQGRINEVDAEALVGAADRLCEVSATDALTQIAKELSSGSGPSFLSY